MKVLSQFYNLIINNPAMPNKIYYNAHAHSFTIDHVPDDFAKKLIWFYFLFPIRWIKKHKAIQKIIKLLNKPFILKLLKLVWRDIDKSLNRLLSFIKFFEIAKTQKDMIDLLKGYYPPHTHFVLLTMDMEFMGAGKPIQNFQKQVNELAVLKSNPAYTEFIYPFIFADPRRENIYEIVMDAIEQKKFTGIKLYPALGYFPFDKRLRTVYEHALKHDLPLTTHCIAGVVFFRGTKQEAFGDVAAHPIALKQPLYGTKGIDFTLNFTHPLNFNCLMDINILKRYWGDDAPDLSNLKICMGHFGGGDEWNKYLTDPWLPAYNAPTGGSLNIDNAWFDEMDKDCKIIRKAYSWFSVICDMMRKFPKMYADVSYTVSDDRTFPLLKLLLTSDYYTEAREGHPSISSRILFGTDFFVVSKAGSEREMSIKLREYLGDNLFGIIACENPVSFLENNFNKP
jgi:predicted TIM-barrel fold metal-dependent hydrolase